MSVAFLELGSGPLALCLHGFPDSAHSWRYLLPKLADAGFHAVAPFMRGYAPTSVPADSCYSVGALAHDAIALHDALDGDGKAVVIGHDWGAEAAYAAAALAPERWRTLVTMSVPPASLDDLLFADYEQLKRFFYLFVLGASWGERVVSANGMAFLDRLWADWSPGYDAREDLRRVKDCLPDPSHLSAALGYYRAFWNGDDPACQTYAVAQAAVDRRPPQPALYLRRDRDGCIRADLVTGVPEHLGPGSRIKIVERAGHFLHLERPAEVNDLILSWVTPDRTATRRVT